MNTTSVRNLAIFAVGALLGSAVTYKLLKTKYEQIAQEEIDDVREYAKNQIDYYDAFYRNEIDKLSANTVDPLEAADREEHEKLTRKYGLAEKKDLNTVLRERGLMPIPDESRLTPKVDLYPEDDEPEEEDEFESTPFEDMDAKEENIYMIPQETFVQSDNVEVLTLVYYAEDGVVTDERDEPVPEPEKLLGPDFFKYFGTDELEDLNVLYVRNEIMSTDFEVVRNMGSYVETVLGYKQEPVEKVVHHKVVEPKPKAKAKPRAKKLVNDGDI